MDDDLPQRTSASLPAAKPRSMRFLPPKSATERLTPATKREIAVELEKLRSIFGYEAEAWKTAVPLYLDALSDLPYDMLSDAVSACIGMAGAGDFFPKPGVLRGLVSDRLELRRSQARSESKQGRDEEEWPDWLREIWGPMPQGRPQRNEALACDAHKRIESMARGVRQQRVDGSFDGLSNPLQQIHDALGVSATERKVPRHEDPDELQKDAAELDLQSERKNT